ncbi:MAG: SMC family ATPase [Thermoplasmata archaeon]|nr:SMC family ATPase [Thermoplasmata archaeon]
MKLRSLTLENYRKFENTTVEFPEGLVGILGLNGVGKSTIIEAIAWTLYGNQQTIVRTSKEDVKRIGSAPKDSCKVTLEFELAGENYQVMRQMKGVNFTMKAEVQVNNKLAAQSTREVTEFIENKVGMDYQAFFTSVFAKQNELNALSGLASHARKRLVLRMLNIDAVDFAIKNLRKDKNIKKTETATFRKVLYDECGVSKIEMFTSELKSTKSNRDALAPDIKQKRKKIGDLEKELKTLKKAIEVQEKNRDEFNRINNETVKQSVKLEAIKNDIATREKELEVLNEQERKLKALAGSEDEWKQVKQRQEQLDKLKQEYQKKLELGAELEKLLTDIDSRKSKLEVQETERDKYQDLEAELKK